MQFVIAKMLLPKKINPSRKKVVFKKNKSNQRPTKGSKYA